MRGDELLARGGPRVRLVGRVRADQDALQAASDLLAVEANVGPHDGGVTRAQALGNLARAMKPLLA